MTCGSLQRINVVIALSIRETVNENSEPRYIGFVKNRSPMKALTNHVVPSRSAQLVHFPMVLLSSPLLLLSLFLSFILTRYTFAHGPTRTYIHESRMYRSLLFPFIFYIRRPANIEAETNSCTLIQFVRIKDTINNVFSRARFSEIEATSTHPIFDESASIFPLRTTIFPFRQI